VDQLDLSGFDVGTEETGRPAYPPDILVSVVFYAFSLGVFSSREIARRCVSDCAFMFAAAGLRPSYRSIARFRAQYEDELAALFAQIVAICRRVGLGATDIVAVDGTRQHANASIDAHIRQEQLDKELQRIRRDMEQLLEKAARVDEAEQKELDLSQEDQAVPEQLANKRARQAAIEKALQQLRESGDKEANSTDPDSRLQKFKEGSRPGYNAQVAVSGDDGLILACDVVQEAGDTGQLLPMLDQVQANTEESPGVAVADAGYEKGDVFERLVEREQDAIVATACMKSAYKRRRKTGRFQWVDFDYDPNKDEYICPAGHRLLRVGSGRSNGRPSRIYEGTACADCRLRSACVARGLRRLKVAPTNPYVLAMAERRRHDRQRDQLGARRKALVEGHFGHMKHNLRWRHFTRRGLAACRSEFRLLCAAFNLSKLAGWLDSVRLSLWQVLPA